MEQLKVTDLMVGDWLKYNNDYVRIHEVSALSFCFLQGIRMHMILTSDTSEVSPIPLTPDILKANGWVVKKNHVQKGNFGDSPLMLWNLTENKILRHFVHEMEISDLSSDEGYRLRFRCDYVHELQHALRLCKLDELADNLKIEQI